MRYPVETAALIKAKAEEIRAEGRSFPLGNPLWLKCQEVADDLDSIASAVLRKEI